MSPLSSRRRFFRDAVGKAIKPLAEFLEQRVGTLKPVVRLRPPGAVPETRFLEVCHRCGSCADTCPVHAIILLGVEGKEASGTPIVDPDLAACIVCEGLRCTHVCPSGALRPLDDPRAIRMGVAEVYAPLCLRSRGETCTRCVDECPVGEDAIRCNNDGAPEVRLPACVGCGVCQLHCPTSPKAVVVKPWPR
jgi:ferredoxin-type protein NapG